MSVDIKQITKFYGKQKALDNVTFSIRKGELLGFLGPNGAGKSTLMKIITGYLPSDEGEVFIDGMRITIDSVDIRKQIGYLPENNPLYPDLYVTEYLEMAAGFYYRDNLRHRVMEMIALTGLEKEKHKKIGSLSKGYRQRVGLAQALVHQPSVLILDEPTNGLDPNQLGEIRALISEISSERTVLLSSHILQEIEAICRRIVIIHQGKLVADSDLSRLKEKNMTAVQQVYLEFDQSVHSTAIMNVKGIDSILPEGNGYLVSAVQGTDIRPALFRFAADSGLTLLSLTERQQNLDEIFRQLTRE